MAVKHQLIQAVADQLDLPKTQAQAAVDAVLDNIRDLTFQQGSLSIRGFGKFTLRRTKARPAQGTVGPSPARDVIKFTAGVESKVVVQ